MAVFCHLVLLGDIGKHVTTLLLCRLIDFQTWDMINTINMKFKNINDIFKFYTTFLSPIH